MLRYFSCYETVYSCRDYQGEAATVSNYLRHLYISLAMSVSIHFHSLTAHHGPRTYHRIHIQTLTQRPSVDPLETQHRTTYSRSYERPKPDPSTKTLTTTPAGNSTARPTRPTLRHPRAQTFAQKLANSHQNDDLF